MKYIITILLSFCTVSITFAQTIDHKVDSVLALMTLQEKVGQMTQVERGALANVQDLATYSIGSILSGGGSVPTPNTVAAWSNMYDGFQNVALQSNLGIPLVYGIDAVHGHNNVYGAVIFPHNIGMGCTWNPELIRSANEVIAREVAATGIDWTFAPCIAVPRNERWGRTYEGFGETLELQKMMAEASVLGLQGNVLNGGETVLGCAKHFVGDGGTTNGTDQGNTQLTEQVLRDIHMQGYIDAIDAGVGTVMATYNSWNGQKVHGHEYLLTDVLKTELGFEGFVISDWKGVDQVHPDYRTAIKQAINAGVDMVMVPDRYVVFINHLIDLVQTNEVSEDRIDDAVRRILKQKFLLNLFEEPFTDTSLNNTLGSQEHRDVARQVVRESMVVMNAKNDVLPLQKNNQRILVAGSLADDLGAQCGGWTISWAGGNGDITIGTDILAGIENVVENSEVIYAEDGSYNGSVDVAVVVIGEKIPYVEGGGDRLSLNLDQSDVTLLKGLKETGVPIIALLISGRPMIITELLPYTDAMIALWYPGTEGEGVAEILFGDYDPTGRLSNTWPRDMSQVPINIGDENYDPLFVYQHGLTEFPTQEAAEKLLPYGASTNQEGNEILLTLTDKVTSMNAALSDFEIRINGSIIPNIIQDISLATYDSSMLIIELAPQIELEENITISYTGSAISAITLSLDSFENYYVYNAVNASSVASMIPGRVQAEHFFAMSGIQTEACTDVGGGLNVGWIEEGDWMKYNVEVTESGLYRLEARIAGFSGGSLVLKFDDVVETEVYYTSTGGWQNWQDFPRTFYLNEGSYVFEALAQSDAFNINYFDFELVSTAVANPSQPIDEIEVFPNPTKEDLLLKFSNKVHQNGSISLKNAAGQSVQIIHEGTLVTGTNTFSVRLNEALPAGVYFLEIKDEIHQYFKKVVKE